MAVAPAPARRHPRSGAGCTTARRRTGCATPDAAPAPPPEALVASAPAPAPAPPRRLRLPRHRRWLLPRRPRRSWLQRRPQLPPQRRLRLLPHPCASRDSRSRTGSRGPACGASARSGGATPRGSRLPLPSVPAYLFSSWLGAGALDCVPAYLFSSWVGAGGARLRAGVLVLVLGWAPGRSTACRRIVLVWVGAGALDCVPAYFSRLGWAPGRSTACRRTCSRSSHQPWRRGLARRRAGIGAPDDPAGAPSCPTSGWATERLHLAHVELAGRPWRFGVRRDAVDVPPVQRRRSRSNSASRCWTIPRSTRTSCSPACRRRPIRLRPPTWRVAAHPDQDGPPVGA